MRSKTISPAHSISEGQVLSEPYSNDKARIIVKEMADSLALQLLAKRLAKDGLVLDVGYDRGNCNKGGYTGPVHIDHYGRKVPKGAHGTARLNTPTNLSSQIIKAVVDLFDQITIKKLTVRRITIAAIRVVEDEGIMHMDLFTDTKKLEKEKNLQEAMLEIKQKYSDLLPLSRPEPIKPRMTLENRSKIFSPFAALRGYEDEISAEDMEKLNKLGMKMRLAALLL